MSCLVVGDYSQIEPRLMAHWSRDPRLTSVYLDGGGDVYIDMARAVFETDDVTREQRDICKTLVLGMSYGAGDKKVGAILTVNGYPTSVETGAEYVSRLRSTYPVFFSWRDEVIGQAHRDGFVSTIGGRHRRLGASFLDSRNFKLVGYGERQAVNAIIQGSAADIVRRVMVACQTRVVPEFELLAQVHDELVWEWRGELCSKAGLGGHAADCGLRPSDMQLAELREVAETGHGFNLRVPLLFDVHVGDSWYSGKEGIDLELPADLEEAEAREEE